jgi:hypothetical protein
VQNDGTIEAGLGSTLEIESVLMNNGTVEANGGTVLTQGQSFFNAGVVGGTLVAQNGGVIEIGDVNGGLEYYPTLENISIAVGTTLVIQADSAPSITGDVVNDGTIEIGSDGGPTFAEDSTLGGLGVVTLGGGALAVANLGYTTDSSLTIESQQTVEGFGVLAAVDGASMTNDGLVLANQTGVLQVYNTTNEGSFEATDGGTLPTLHSGEFRRDHRERRHRTDRLGYLRSRNGDSKRRWNARRQRKF